jgi:hypothetical protein
MRSNSKTAAVLALSTLIITTTAPRRVVCAATVVQGGTPAAPTDVTAHLIANESLQLNSGSFQVTIPAAGVAGTVKASATTSFTTYDLTSYGAGHFVDPNAPSIIYRGTISGTGILTVTNATNATVNPGTTAFSGGMLLFTNPQTFWSGSAAPSLIIMPNTTVAFDRGQMPDTGGSLASDATISRNVTNNGYLYCYNNYNNTSWGSITSSISGAGVVTFENGNVMTNGHSYTGRAYVMNGSHVQSNADLSVSNVVQSNIFSFETVGPNYLVGPNPPVQKSIYKNTFYTFGADTQIQSNGGQGIQVFTGLALSGSNGTKKDFIPVADSRKLDYFVHSYGGFGLVFYIQATMQLGDGQTIVDNGDGTNNVFIQANVTGGSAFISTGNFETTPTSLDQAYHNQAIAFDYSGTYHYDACVNVVGSGTAQLSARTRIGNFVVMNPDPQNAGKAPNYLILTCPMLTQGLVRIEPNAILQLGDGTNGTSETRTVTLSNGTTYSGTYSDSYGNGMVLTKLNSPASFVTSAYDQIINDGELIVDNSPNVLDITMADATLAPLLVANQLDTIVGRGSVEQMGQLPLVLDGDNTYSGGTTIDGGATLYVASAAALGSTLGTGGNGSGKVTNHGVLANKKGNFVIRVPGDYDQSGVP